MEDLFKGNFKVITLKEFGEDKFLQTLEQLRKENNLFDARNSNWFEVLPHTYKKYEEWFFLIEPKNQELVAFSTIQKYYEGCYRLCTRTYIMRPWRRFVLPRDDMTYTPTLYFTFAQLEYIKTWETVFVSMQSLKRRSTIKRLKHKFEWGTPLEWIMSDHLHQTCANPHDANCFQNVIYNGEELKLPKITIEEWKKRYG